MSKKETVGSAPEAVMDMYIVTNFTLLLRIDLFS